MGWRGIAQQRDPMLYGVPREVRRKRDQRRRGRVAVTLDYAAGVPFEVRVFTPRNLTTRPASGSKIASSTPTR